MSPRQRYLRWAWDVPEGCLRRDWRLHPLMVARTRAFTFGWTTRKALVPALCECLGLRPRLKRIRLMPWGARDLRWDLPLTPRAETRRMTVDEFLAFMNRQLAIEKAAATLERPAA